MYIHKIKDSAQKISEAIAAVVNCNVTITDTQLIRIAGTGPYKKEITNYAPKESAFVKALKDKEIIIIENPRYESMCQNCTNVEFCTETYEICCPIIWEDNTLGVIGIFANDEIQKRHLQAMKEDILVFLSKMSSLIASKVGEQVLFEHIETINKELVAVIQNVNHGVICVNHDGKIHHINEKAVQIFGISEKIEDIINKNIKDYWKNSTIMDAINKNSEYIDKEEYYERDGYRKGLSTTVKLFYLDNNVKGAVVTFTDLDSIQKSAFRHREKSFGFTFDTLVGTSHSLQVVKEKAIRVSKSDSTILITGESGTGKEIFARAIHNESNRSKNPFVAVNCSAIPETLLESELFGYEPGAFTGANEKGKIGKIELANKGTFFFDEIGDMPLFIQAKLLRVLQERKVTRIGGLDQKTLDVRIISATNKNLEELIEKRMFREDLYYRLNVIPLILPSLSQRVEDIPLLVKYFIKIYNIRFDKQIKGLTEEAMNFLMDYKWPGNVRELENVVEYGINFAENEYIHLKDIKDRCRVTGLYKPKKLKDIISEYEKKTIQDYLDILGWTEEGKEKTADVLGISRATLYRKLSLIEHK